MEPGEFLANSATATLRKTALNAVHRALGAKMVDFGGWDMPVEYPSAGGLVAEHKGARIRQLRGDVLQENLAAYLGISQGQLSKIERGRLGPTPETVVRLIERFGKSADWILTGRV